MKYWDSSAIVPLLIAESLSDAAANCLRSDPALITWWATPVECVSALARREREGTLAPASAQQAIKRLTLLRDQWVEVEPSQQVRELSMRLLRVHPLRAADAMQLAAALVVRNGYGPGLTFVCCDDRLQLAAEKEGLDVERLAASQGS